MTAAYDRPEEIEDDIRETRARIDSTIDALRAKMSPGELLDSALGTMRDGGAEMGRNFARRVKNNPLPLALMGAAVAWMMVSDSRPRPVKVGDGAGRGNGSRRGYAGLEQHDIDVMYPHFTAEESEAVSLYDRVHNATAGISRASSETAEAFAERFNEAKAKTLGLTRDAGETFAAFKDRVEAHLSELGSRAEAARARVMERIGGMADRARSRAGDAAGMIRDRSRAIGEQTGRLIHEQPLLLGVIGLTVGALAGALLPKTRRENELMGELGEDLRHRAEDYAERAVDAAGNVVERTGEAASEALRSEGLTPEKAEENVRKVARKAGEAGRRTVRAATDEAERQIHRGGELH